MSTPILATKLYIPRHRANIVLRSRLTERLNEGLHRKLTLISAPAGFGKTTLVSEWIADGKRPTAWISLDEGDNDSTRFWLHFIAALQTLFPHIGMWKLDALQSPQQPSIESLLTSLLNEIVSIPDDFILVVDDYHSIDSKQIDDALVYFIERLPSQMHLVLATREDPDLPLARLRASDQLIELRVKDLRFTELEAAEFLNQAMGLHLSAEDIAALETRTEGWIVGLQLAALSMHGLEDTTGFIQSFTGSHRFVMDYLVEEVLKKQPNNLQNFLLQTSLLERMCGPLCDAVLLSPSVPGQETLEYLDRANLFVILLDHERRWFRYHHLFAEVLRARLMREQSDRVKSLHLRASAWHEQSGFRADAIRHALAAADFKRAADLIEMEWSANSGTYFQNATWLGWVKALPEKLIRTRPNLCVGLAWEYLFSGELEAAETRMRVADRLLEQPTSTTVSLEGSFTRAVVLNEEQSRSLRALLAIAWAFYAQALGDVASTEKHARRALTLVSEETPYMHGLASAQLGLACWTNGDLENAFKYMAEAMASLRISGNLLFATSCAYVLADIKIAQGRLFEAASIYEEALQFLTAKGGPVLQGAADLFLGLSNLHRERGNVEVAGQHLIRSEELGKQAALPEWPYGLYLAQARVKEDQRDLDSALKLLDEAEKLYHRGPIPNVHPIAALKTRVWIGQGRLNEALGWAHKEGLSVDDNLGYLHEFEHITLARILIARYKSGRIEKSVNDAIKLLQRLLKAAEDGGRVGNAIEILILQAIAHESQGNIQLALAPLERALTLAESEGYVRTFVYEGAPMANLLAKVKAVGSRAKYIQKLLAAFENTQPVMLVSQPVFEPLSQREMEVLQLLAQGLSNQEISERLFLALDTVKGHNRKIFDKLQVQRRTEAVARARELGLL